MGRSLVSRRNEQVTSAAMFGLIRKYYYWVQKRLQSPINPMFLVYSPRFISSIYCCNEGICCRDWRNSLATQFYWWTSALSHISTPRRPRQSSLFKWRRFTLVIRIGSQRECRSPLCDKTGGKPLTRKSNASKWTLVRGLAVSSPMNGWSFIRPTKQQISAIMSAISTRVAFKIKVQLRVSAWQYFVLISIWTL